jgi:putative transposase
VGLRVIEISGELDHVHTLFEAHPQIELSKAINNFKTVSSRYIRKEFEEQLTPYYWKPYFWNRSYCINSTGGATVKIIKQYL